MVRQIYAEVKANNEYEEGFSISFERTYNMVYRLCKHNPETLFRKLEKEAQNWLEVLRERLVAQLSTTSGTASQRSAPVLQLLLLLLLLRVVMVFLMSRGVRSGERGPGAQVPARGAEEVRRPLRGERGVQRRLHLPPQLLPQAVRHHLCRCQQGTDRRRHHRRHYNRRLHRR